jgi:ketosteroid isomerase-like protein
MTTTAPDSRRTASLLALMKRGDDAFNAHDVEAMNAVHHPDMVAHITGNAGPLFGRDAHAQAMQAFFAMFPDVHVDNDPYPVQFGSGDWITVVTRTTGTFTGGLVLPDGRIVPPTGRSFDVEFGQTVRWVGEQVVEIAAFWDSALQARQIGLTPPSPGQGGSA